MSPVRISSEQRERLARAIHGSFLLRQRSHRRLPDPAIQPWESLPESLRESNRAQADALVEKLELLGCELVVATDGLPPLELTEEEVERLAVVEHERWVRDRTAAGWRQGRRDVPLRLTPYLVPWEKLPELVRDLDRAAVRAIPEVLREVGLAAVRRREHETERR